MATRLLLNDILFYSGVTSVGLEADILNIEQQIVSLEARMSGISAESDAAFELTIQLSALEDQLQVRESEREREGGNREGKREREKREGYIRKFTQRKTGQASTVGYISTNGKQQSSGHAPYT